MFYLILAIVSSALISVVMRTSEKYVKNNVSMLAMNYVMCTVMSVFYLTSPGLIPSAEGIGFTTTLGLVNGGMFLGCFLLLQWNIRKNGVVLSSTFMKLGVLVPTIMAVTVFREKATVPQGIGILAALAAILLIQLEKGGTTEKTGSKFGLVAMLLCGGLGDGMSKVYEYWGNAELESHYLLYTFAVALVLCVIVCILKKQKLAPVDVLFGLLIGIPNYFSAKFLLKSVSSVPAVIAYPTYSVGTIVLVTLAGVLCFRERLSKRQILAMGIILAAIALLNLKL